MPRVIDYADRFDGIRESVYAITLEQGVGAIDLDAVAERLFMSPRTIRRLIASVDVLPHLGSQWAERRQHFRTLRLRDRADWMARPRHEQALDALLDELPDRDCAEDRLVWWSLVLAHAATRDWARAAQAARAEVLTELCARVLGDLADDEERVAEVTRLRLLAIGAISQLCLGTLTHEDAAAAIRAHVGDVLGRRATRDDAA